MVDCGRWTRDKGRGWVDGELWTVAVNVTMGFEGSGGESSLPASLPPFLPLSLSFSLSLSLSLSLSIYLSSLSFSFSLSLSGRDPSSFLFFCTLILSPPSESPAHSSHAG